MSNDNKDINNSSNNEDISTTQGEKLVENKITLEGLKLAIDSDIEIKGYIDSLVDKRTSKGIQAWKDKNLEKLIDDEIKNRNPEPTEEEKLINKLMKEKQELELKLQYNQLLKDNNLDESVLKFVAGPDLQTTNDNILEFKSLVDEMTETKAKQMVEAKLKQASYNPLNTTSSSKKLFKWSN